jgi:predicted enzyme related to lactoylglutathione lyase
VAAEANDAATRSGTKKPLGKRRIAILPDEAVGARTLAGRALRQRATPFHFRRTKELTEENVMGNPVVHWELWSADPGKCSEFYAKAFDWKIESHPGLDYWMADTDGPAEMKGINGGFFRPQGDPKGWPGKLAFYILVDDLAAALERVKAAGGKVLVERQEVGDMGAFALFADPEDRVLGLWVATGR